MGRKSFVYYFLAGSLLFMFLFLSPTVFASTFTVTSTGDSGPGTLRQAIIDANSNPGPDTINFNLPGGSGTITLLSNLPPITDTVTIDGSGQDVTIDGNHNASPIFWIDSDDTIIENLTLINPHRDGMVIFGSNVSVLTNTISTTSGSGGGIYLVADREGVVRGNEISGYYWGVLIEPNYNPNISPDGANDDTLNSSLTIVGNTFSNLQRGVVIKDDYIGNIQDIYSQNTFSSTTHIAVEQDWYGVVELLHGYGSHWSAVTSGQVITLTNDCTTFQFTKFDKSDSHPNLGVWGFSNIDYDNIFTWPWIPEGGVDNQGHYYSCGKSTIVTTGNYNGSTVFSFDGNSTTDPVDPDYGLPFTNDKSSTTVGRYQIAQILFEEPPTPTPTPLPPTPTPASPTPTPIPEPGTFVLVIPGIAGIGLWYKMHREKNR